MRFFKRKFYIAFYNVVKKIKFGGKSNIVLFVRFDALGDYILFRNFVYDLKECEQYKNYKFYFLGNVSYKNLVENLDKDIYDKVYFIEPHFLFDVSFKKILLLLKIKLRRIDILINSVHSRTEETDSFIGDFGAKYLIGSEGDNTNFVNNDAYIKSSSKYNKLIPVLDKYHFEFERNRSFFSNLLNVKLDTKLKIAYNRLGEKHQKHKIGLVIGAGHSLRRWSPERFVELISLIQLDYPNKYQFVLIGSENEKFIAEEIIRKVNDNSSLCDLVGKLTLIDFVHLIGNLCLLISNETSAVHISAACETETICISNGNHFGRFNPYPTTVSNKITTIYPTEDFYVKEKQMNLMRKTAIQSNIDINLIPAESVYAKMKDYLKIP